MCGIAGIVGHANAVEITMRMTAALKHRGPDGSRVQAVAPNAALGHSRLAILDLSERGAQPMTSRDGRWTLVFNGEIFNYVELREELPAIDWQSDTDTEVLLEGVAHWGIARTLQKSVGMFAAAFWDRREQALTLVRDRVGEKPLVYFQDGRVLAFASEMKALAPLHESRLDPAAVDLFLALGYVPAPHAIFRGMRKLPAGHSLRFCTGKVAVERWWHPENAEPVAGERAGELRSLIADAVRLRLRADVPVALALSGGVDSSILAAELARQGAPATAFTVSFDGDETDLPYAQIVARRFGLRHETVRAEGPSLESRVREALAQYDEPFADSSSVASLALAKAVAPFKVILEGNGGDEAFGGYRHYEFIAAKQTLKAAAAAVGLTDGNTSVYVQSKATFRSAERVELLNGHDSRARTLDRLLASDPYLQTARDSALKHALWSDRHLALANGLTYKMDMALSAHSIEGRAPFLDHRILEWAQGLDDRDLVRGREKKVLLRQTYAAELPAEILKRKKHGFGGPVSQWLAGPLRQLVADALPCPLLDAASQATLAGQRLWTVLNFALWAKQWGATW